MTTTEPTKLIANLVTATINATMVLCKDSTPPRDFPWLSVDQFVLSMATAQRKRPTSSTLWNVICVNDKVSLAGRDIYVFQDPLRDSGLQLDTPSAPPQRESREKQEEYELPKPKQEALRLVAPLFYYMVLLTV